MIEHHNCHIYAPISVLGDNNEKYLIFSMDGGGDGLSSTVSIYENKEVKTIAKTTTSSSIGLIYGGVTELLGMRSLEHEYKVMGLAAYAKKDYFMKTYDKVFRDLVTLNDDLTFTCKYDTNFIQFYLKEKVCVERFDNVAGALQYFTEDLVIKWIKLAIEKTGIKNVMLSGGVFMNVKLNQKIIELKEIDKVFIMPSSGDESNVFGATAYFVKNELKRDLKQQLPIYLGMEYSNNEIEKFIKENQIDTKYKVEYVENIEKKVAQLLADFKVVARFKGRTEFGARSLGNRAILANPSDMKSFYMVNDQIKVRDFWMPFAPSILDSYAEKYLKNYTDKYIPYYMVATYNSSDKFQNECRAAMHQGDKTARPQIVTKSMNEDYYNLIAEFEKLTGIGAVMNTSFNLHGYPLVGTPEQAIFTMDNSDLEYLAIENWLISKR
jgi:carbamoyltransferase